MAKSTNEKARIVIDIEDLREVTVQNEESKKDRAQPKTVNGAVSKVKSTIMCPW